jgi:hypothetical protein
MPQLGKARRSAFYDVSHMDGTVSRMYRELDGKTHSCEAGSIPVKFRGEPIRMLFAEIRI